MKEVSIEKLNLARAARIKVRENNINAKILNSIDFYLEHNFCSDEEMAELEKEVNNIKPY